MSESFFRRVGPKTILALLAVVVVVAALVTPEASTKDQGVATTFSTGPSGVRMAFELAQRMGWKAERRLAPLDSTVASPTTQVVLAPGEALGAHEVHRLLDNVRRGGGLVFGIDGGGEIADSLGIALGTPARLLSGYGDAVCPTPPSFRDRTLLAMPPEVNRIRWRRPAPGPTTVLGTTQGGIERSFTIAVGFPLGRGRIAAISSPMLFTNDVVRLCGLGADIVVARALEFVRPVDERQPRLVFDEFHHGFGMHGGSMKAITRYLSGTPSGRFLAQALVACVLLVLAFAPRPIPPSDPDRIVRRSPLEHADALGHAYADVKATRTATERLVGGVRRRAGRVVASSSSADDSAFLDAVVRRNPSLGDSVARVRRGLAGPVSAREFVSIGEALDEIERQLAMPLSHH
jgi:hypothetical protein